MKAFCATGAPAARVGGGFWARWAHCIFMTGFVTAAPYARERYRAGEEGPARACGGT